MNDNYREESQGGGEEKKADGRGDGMTIYVGTAGPKLVQDRCRWLLG